MNQRKHGQLELTVNDIEPDKEVKEVKKEDTPKEEKPFDTLLKGMLDVPKPPKNKDVDPDAKPKKANKGTSSKKKNK